MENKVDKGTLAIKIVGISLIVLAIVGVILFMVFNQPRVHKDLDLSYAGKYELTSIEGHTDKDGNEIKPSSYEYNYIMLGEDGHYEIANKYGNKKTSVKGVWYVENGKVIFEGSKMLGLVKTKSEGDIADGKITMTLNSGDKKVIMILTRK